MASIDHFVDGLPLRASQLNALISAVHVTMPAFVVGEHPGSKLNTLLAASNLTQFVPAFVEDDYFDASDLNKLVDAINVLNGFAVQIGGYVLPIATATTLGGIRIGQGMQIDPLTGVTAATGAGQFFIPVDADGFIPVDADGLIPLF